MAISKLFRNLITTGYITLFSLGCNEGNGQNHTPKQVPSQVQNTPVEQIKKVEQDLSGLEYSIENATFNNPKVNAKIKLKNTSGRIFSPFDLSFSICYYKDGSNKSEQCRGGGYYKNNGLKLNQEIEGNLETNVYGGLKCVAGKTVKFSLTSEQLEKTVYHKLPCN
jgi:hypothetical protein